uniref:GLPGLI family protein n=2 Tax=Gelidibacter sp. TaxID=2018083 RepID=UPI004048EE0C
MIKKIIPSILLFFVLKIYSQQDSINVFKIEFLKILTLENSQSFTTFQELQKYIELDVSVFNKISKSENSNQLIEDKDDDAIFYFTPQGENINLVYKDYSTGKFYSKHEIARKYFLVEDSLQIFNWEILDKTKEILGYNCQLASMVHRGRAYKAWFAPELPLGGPWKFDGLPGMILSIQSDDLFLSFEAMSIKSNKIKSAKIDNPFKTKDAITWETFKKLYKEKAIALSKYSPDEGGTGGIILSRKGIETYIDENDPDYTADKELEKSQGKN